MALNDEGTGIGATMLMQPAGGISYGGYPVYMGGNNGGLGNSSDVFMWILFIIAICGGGFGNSFARGRTGNARRDNMRGDMRYSNGGYSMDNDDLIDELNDLMRDADDKMKPEFQRFIKKLEQM